MVRAKRPQEVRHDRDDPVSYQNNSEHDRTDGGGDLGDLPTKQICDLDRGPASSPNLWRCRVSVDRTLARASGDLRNATRAAAPGPSPTGQSRLMDEMVSEARWTSDAANSHIAAKNGMSASMYGVNSDEAYHRNVLGCWIRTNNEVNKRGMTKTGASSDAHKDKVLGLRLRVAHFVWSRAARYEQVKEVRE